MHTVRDGRLMTFSHPSNVLLILLHLSLPRQFSCWVGDVLESGYNILYLLTVVEITMTFVSGQISENKKKTHNSWLLLDKTERLKTIPLIMILLISKFAFEKNSSTVLIKHRVDYLLRYLINWLMSVMPRSYIFKNAVYQIIWFHFKVLSSTFC